MTRRRSAPTYLTERGGRIYYHYRIVVRHAGVERIVWVNRLSNYPGDWRRSLEAVRIHRATTRARIIAEIDRDSELGDRDATWAWWRTVYIGIIAARKKRLDDDRRYLARAGELWDSLPLKSISRARIEAAMTAQAEIARATQAARGRPILPTTGAATANRWRAAVSACLEEARRRELIPSNPARDVKPFRETPPRARVLSADEQARLAAAVLDEPNPILRTAFVILIETGARLSEVLNMRWHDLDLQSATWRIPSPKSGHPQVIPLPPHVADILASLPHTSEWTLPGPSGQRRYDLRKPWRRIRAKAAIPADVTIHDLRRSFGLRVARTAGLHIASRLLRHSSIRITERVYAPLGLDELRQASTDAAILTRPKKP